MAMYQAGGTALTVVEETIRQYVGSHVATDVPAAQGIDAYWQTYAKMFAIHKMGLSCFSAAAVKQLQVRGTYEDFVLQTGKQGVVLVGMPKATDSLVWSSGPNVTLFQNGKRQGVYPLAQYFCPSGSAPPNKLTSLFHITDTPEGGASMVCTNGSVYEASPSDLIFDADVNPEETLVVELGNAVLEYVDGSTGTRVAADRAWAMAASADRSAFC